MTDSYEATVARRGLSAGRSQEMGGLLTVKRSKLSRRAATIGLAAMAALAVTPQSAVAQADPCPNAQFRQGASAHLPECRAFEKVSPQDKNGGDVYAVRGLVQATADGAGVAWSSTSSFNGGEGAQLLSEYVTRRTPNGWTTTNVVQNAAIDLLGPTLDKRIGYKWFSSDLSSGIFMRNDGPSTSRNLHMVDFASGATVRMTPESLTPMSPMLALNAQPNFADAATDGSQILFEAWEQLTPDAPAPANNRPHLYKYADGDVEFLGLLPNGTAAGQSVAGSGVSGPGYIHEQRSDRAMSDDGERVYFTVPTTLGSSPGTLGTVGEVYLRDGDETIHVSASQRTDCAGDPTCGGDGIPDLAPVGTGRVQFATASTDGGVVYFRSCRQLTDDAPAAPAACTFSTDGLYRYDVESGALEYIHSRPNSGGVVGTSDDGDIVYFVVTVSIPGGSELRLRRWEEGVVTDIGLAEDGPRDFNTAPNLTAIRSSRVSSDGRYVVWAAVRPEDLTNPDAPVMLRLFDSVTGETTCVSCPASGELGSTAFLNGENERQPVALRLRQYGARAFDEDYRWLFFSTRDGLVEEDTNGRWDVYRYEVATGRQELMSGGSQPGDALLGDVSADGSTVFIVTDQRLSGWDRDGLRDMYAVRVNGGFPEPPVEQAPCQGDACQGGLGAGPAQRGAPGSAGLRGRGDVAVERPAASVRLGSLGSAKLARLARGRGVRLRVRVSGPGRVRLVGRARLGKRRVVVARGSARARRAGVVRVGVRLSRRARARLADGRRLRMRLTARARGVSDARTLTLGGRSGR